MKSLISRRYSGHRGSSVFEFACTLLLLVVTGTQVLLTFGDGLNSILETVAMAIQDPDGVGTDKTIGTGVRCNEDKPCKNDTTKGK